MGQVTKAVIIVQCVRVMLPNYCSEVTGADIEKEVGFMDDRTQEEAHTCPHIAYCYSNCNVHLSVFKTQCNMYMYVLLHVPN